MVVWKMIEILWKLPNRGRLPRMKVGAAMGLRGFPLHRSRVETGTMLENQRPQRHFLSRGRIGFHRLGRGNKQFPLGSLLLLGSA
jgi:hypothetical protein